MYLICADERERCRVNDATRNPAGSIWRRWDLHLHTPGTKLNNAFGGSDDNTWDRYIDALEESPVQAFGITDYFSCDTYFELTSRFKISKPKSSKCFFPNIEFRLSESIAKDGSHANIHVIFDNDVTICDRQKLQRFLTNLETQAIDNVNTKRRCADLTTTADFESATISLNDLLSALDKTFGDSKPYLLAFPANNDGIRSTDVSSSRKVLLSDRIDGSCDLFFGNEHNTEYFLNVGRYANGEAQPKPVVSGSDAHSFDDLERLTGDVAGFPPTWIKADTTFFGLQQICHEPALRVHITSIPNVIVRQQEDGTKFLNALHIDQVQNYDERNGRWFKNIVVPLNPELTAIIGNKGSGKSALVDIIGLLGESRQEEYFSFLTDDSKGKKFRQPGFAENFVACAVWLSGKSAEKSLASHSDVEGPETVRYLPQNYFEQLTNEIEIEQFRREIEEVVFSHVEETERLGTSSFAALEELKTLQSKHEISNLKQQLREINIEIVRLEEQRSPAYRRKLGADLKAKRLELEAIDGGKPKQVVRPDTQTPEQLELARNVDAQTTLLNTINRRIESAVSKTTSLKTRIQEAKSLKESIVAIQTALQKSISDIGPGLSTLDIAIEEIIRFSIDFVPLDKKIVELEGTVAKLEKDNGLDFKSVEDFGVLVTLPDLRGAYAHFKNMLEQLKEQMSAPLRRYQTYVERLSAWDTRRLEILGSGEDPKPGALRYLEESLEYVDNVVVVSLQERTEARRELVKEIYESKSAVLRFYNDLRASVEERLQAVRAEGFEIQISASFVVDRGFRREFLSYIDQRKRGPFRNEQDAQLELTRHVQSVDWNEFAEVMGFCKGLIDAMKNYNRQELSVADQAHDIKELYDFLFSMEYLTPKYELRLGGKNLNELSPGEKGLLLLIFYLQLDRANTPLVIDQPEDNLDNASIFKVLATCIRDAKSRRQVILVTHNPNLAVGADAEQVVYVKLEKASNYKFSYESGSIENPALNRRIVDVLEGSQPAFVKRRLKYGI